jgi:multisubunit Na+/H+ antiporter MnhC subunit
MIEQLLVWLAFTIGFLFFSLLRPNSARIVIGLFFIAMSLGVNLMFVLVDARSFVALGADSFIPLYRDLFRTYVAAHPVALATTAVLAELAIGIMMLCGGRIARAGLFGAMLFLLAIAPMNLATAPNVILATALLLMLLRHDAGRAGELVPASGPKRVAAQA